MTKYKASDVVLVKDGKLSNDVEVYLASEADAEIARLREALELARCRIISCCNPDGEICAKCQHTLDMIAALSSSPQSCTCGYASVGHHLSCPLFNQTHSTSSPQSGNDTRDTTTSTTTLPQSDGWECQCHIDWSHQKEECPRCGQKRPHFPLYSDGWISVKNRWPSDSRDVLWFHKGGTIHLWGYEGDDEDVADVTHWRPLPEPPGVKK